MEKIIKIKKDTFYSGLLVVIVALFLFPLFRSGLYQSHDGEVHVARFASYFQAFHDGQLIPRWSGNLNYGYGAPVFIFYYPLPGYLASALHLFGIGWESVYKLIIGVAAV